MSEKPLNPERSFSLKPWIEPLIAVLMVMSVTGIMYFALDRGYELYAFAGFLGLALCYIFIKFPKIWIYTVLLSSFVFFHGSTEGISAIDVATALLYNGFLYIWIFWETLVNRNKIVHSVKDWFILIFFFLLIFNVAIALFIGTTLTAWISEYVLSSTILLYFPVRKYFGNRKDLKILLIVFGLSALLASLYHLYIYKEAIIERSIYVFELGGSLKVNQALYTICTAVGLIFILHSKSFISRIIMIIFTGLNFLSLLSTFSRTFWLILMFLVFILFLYLRSKRLKIIFYGFLISLIFIISVLVIFPNNADFVFSFFEKRLESSGKTVEDISVRARFEEWDKVFERVERYPLGGSGLNKKIKFYSIVAGYSWHTSNIHNGYFALMHKVGLPMTIMYFLVYFIFLLKAEIYSRKIKDPFYKILALISFLTLLMLIIGAITSNQFLYRDNIFQILLAFSFIGIIDSKKDKLMNKEPVHYDRQISRI